MSDDDGEAAEPAPAGATLPARLWHGLRGAAVEAGWVTAHLAMYPWGALSERLALGGPYAHHRTATLSPSQRGLVVADVQAAGTPILLVHGFADNRSIFTVLHRALHQRGFGLVHGINYGLLTALAGDARDAARRLGDEVERLCEQTGAERVHIVGHSLGGVLARYYVQRLGGEQRVHTLITLASPHRGTQAARLIPTRVGGQMHPGSRFLAELDQPAGGCSTRVLAVYSGLDQMVLPRQHARCDHPDLDATNLRLPDVGHITLPADPRAVHAVVVTLATASPTEPPRSA